MSKEVSIEMPESFLLTIAVHGNMGDGDLPDIIRIWAQNECKRLGLQEKFLKLQEERLQELEQRMRNVLGDQAIDNLSSSIARVARAIRNVK